MVYVRAEASRKKRVVSVAYIHFYIIICEVYEKETENIVDG